MSETAGLEWRTGRRIPWYEIRFEQELGGGPGGQSVNRTASRVSLIWCPGHSGSFSAEERARLLRRLSNRINKDGELRIRSSSERSAHRNKGLCTEQLATLIQDALRPVKKRTPTRPTKGSKRRRLDEKTRRAKVKQDRQRPDAD